MRERVDTLLHRFEEARDAGREDEAEVILGRMLEALRDTEPPLDRLQRKVTPWSSFVVLPLFALANAGVHLSGEVLAEAARSPLALGIAAGLVVGKPVGISSFSWMAVRLGLARYPPGVTTPHMAGLGLVAGIGFTVSICIAGLAFGGERIATAKIAILCASVVAGLAGYLLLRILGEPEREPDGEPVPDPAPARP